MTNKPRNMIGKQPVEHFFIVIKGREIQSQFKTVSQLRAEVTKQAGTLLVEVTEQEYALLALCNCKRAFIQFMLSSIEGKISHAVADNEAAGIQNSILELVR